jgi:hypothetical protein
MYGVNYYDELGVAPSASPAEIRQAYKNLARVLHPDQQREEELRRVADLQMKRLNALYEVLADSERRREYDRGVFSGKSRVVLEPPRRRQSASTGLAWVVAAVLGGGLLVWAGWRRDAPAAPAIERAQQVPAPLDGNERPKKRLRIPRVRTPASVASRLPDAPVVSGTVSLAGPPGLSGQTVPEAGPPADVLVLATDAKQERPPGFAGAWFYTPPRVPGPQSGLYPPEYVELVIAETSGELTGRYRARYKVPDKAISPLVSFQFQGSPRRAGAFLWTGSGGARGELHLKLLTENSLAVSWSATELGSSLGLASGTAVLTRREEP